MKRLMDQLMLPMRKWQMDTVEYAAIKSIVFWNPGEYPSATLMSHGTFVQICRAFHQIPKHKFEKSEIAS
jgi:hypothetical protein